MESSKQVWSAQEGYPGDYDYREFYRDIGYELDWESIKPLMGNCPIRLQTGLKYYRVTGNTDRKEPYVRQWAIEKAATHAGNFRLQQRASSRILGISDGPQAHSSGSLRCRAFWSLVVRRS